MTRIFLIATNEMYVECDVIDRDGARIEFVGNNQATGVRERVVTNSPYRSTEPDTPTAPKTKAARSRRAS